MAGDDETPTRPSHYAAVSAVWAALLAGLLAAARERGDGPPAATEILPLGAATFALSKLLAKEKAEAWVREPFVHEHADGDRRPKGDGLRYVVGELLTCTRCAGMWSALGLVALRVTRPREAAVVNTVLGASAVNDFMQSSFSWLCAQANATEAGAELGQRRVAAGRARFSR
jgi:Protein of unknown function (DUF1360)